MCSVNVDLLSSYRGTSAVAALHYIAAIRRIFHALMNQSKRFAGSHKRFTLWTSESTTLQRFVCIAS